jgi:hypothetical protein
MGGAGAAAGPGRGFAADPQAEKKGAASFDTALQLYQSGRFDDATRAFDSLAASDPNAELWAVRSVREGKGCRAAVQRFDRTAQHGMGTPPGWDALLEGALCYRAIGDFGNARRRLTALLNVDSHKDRARAELDRLDSIPQAASPPAVRASPKPASTAAPNSAADQSY